MPVPGHSTQGFQELRLKPAPHGAFTAREIALCVPWTMRHRHMQHPCATNGAKVHPNDRCWDMHYCNNRSTQKSSWQKESTSMIKVAYLLKNTTWGFVQVSIKGALQHFLNIVRKCSQSVDNATTNIRTKYYSTACSREHTFFPNTVKPRYNEVGENQQFALLCWNFLILIFDLLCSHWWIFLSRKGPQNFSSLGQLEEAYLNVKENSFCWICEPTTRKIRFHAVSTIYSQWRYETQPATLLRPLNTRGW